MIKSNMIFLFLIMLSAEEALGAYSIHLAATSNLDTQASASSVCSVNGLDYKAVVNNGTGAAVVSARFIDASHSSNILKPDGVYRGCVRLTEANRVTYIITPAFTIDTTPPITSMSSSLASGTYRRGANIPLSLALSEPVTISGSTSSTKILLGPSPTASATFSGSSSQSLSFNYNISSGDSSPALEVISGGNQLSLGSATIKDVAGNSINRNIPRPSLSMAKTIVVNGTSDIQVNWTKNKETSVNSPGGGYKVFYSSTPGFNIATASLVTVSYQGGTTPITALIPNLLDGTYYIKIQAFSSMIPPGASSGAVSSVTSEVSVNVP